MLNTPDLPDEGVLFSFFYYLCTMIDRIDILIATFMGAATIVALLCGVAAYRGADMGASAERTAAETLDDSIRSLCTFYYYICHLG